MCKDELEKLEKDERLLKMDLDVVVSNPLDVNNQVIEVSGSELMRGSRDWNKVT
jgi:hypothetical protein